MSDPLDQPLRDVLARMIANAPTATNEPVRSFGFDSPHRERRPALGVAVALTAAAGIIGAIAVVTSRSHQESPSTGAPTSTAAGGTTDPSTPAATTLEPAVSGLPATTGPAVHFLCGSDIPVDIEVPNAIVAAPRVNEQPIDPPITPGQLSAVYAVAGGTIEVRWPADERVVYAPDHRDDSEAVPDLTVGVPEDGKSAEIKSDILDPASAGDGFMLKLSATPAAASLAAPCDVLQIRYITAIGRRATFGYKINDFKGFGIDLNPIVSSSAQIDAAPSEAQVFVCPGQTGVGHDVSRPVVTANPVDAFIAFLATAEAADLPRSGYEENELANDQTNLFVYEIVRDGNLVTMITVEPTPGGYAVNRWASSAC